MGVLFPFLINGERTAYVSVKGDEHNNNYLNDNKPKPAIGFKADGTCVLMVIDGRQDNMDGVSERENALALQQLGCVDAFNLDGGGSSTMCFNGEILNANKNNERAVVDFLWFK